MTLNELKHYGRNKTKVLTTKNKRHCGFVKARRACGMTILTASHAVKGRMYNTTVDRQGVITYTPLAEVPQEDIRSNNISLCKAYNCSGNALALNAAGVARLGEYYMSSVDDRGVITYTPLRIALDRMCQRSVASDDSNGSCDDRLQEDQ